MNLLQSADISVGLAKANAKEGAREVFRFGRFGLSATVRRPRSEDQGQAKVIFDKKSEHLPGADMIDAEVLSN